MLVDVSIYSRLLVVGTGEHVGLGRIMLGSTSHYCLGHAPCPVVAVPAPDVSPGGGELHGVAPPLANDLGVDGGPAAGSARERVRIDHFG